MFLDALGSRFLSVSEMGCTVYLSVCPGSVCLDSLTFWMFGPVIARAQDVCYLGKAVKA